MENTKYANNGQLLMADKTYEELTDEERHALIMPWGQHVEDYNTFRVRYNKRGTLVGVDTGLPSQQSLGKRRTIGVDGLQILLNPNKRSREYQMAKKRLGLTNDEADEARRAAKALIEHE